MTAEIQNPKSKIQNVLVVGGAGYVAGLVLPLLAEHFTLRIFDRAAPSFAPPAVEGEAPESAQAWDYVCGDVTDPAALRAAAEGMDLLLYMAMGRWEREIDNVPAAYDVNVKGVHLALDAARKAGVKRAVYTSSLSVHDGHNLLNGAYDREEVPAEPQSVYGLTKWMGEEVCRFFHRRHRFPSIALRLFLPVSVEQWHAQRPPEGPCAHTAAPDLARALRAAFELDHDGFEIIHVTGDTSGRAYRHEKARRLLGWEPLQK